MYIPNIQCSTTDTFVTPLDLGFQSLKQLCYQLCLKLNLPWIVWALISGLISHVWSLQRLNLNLSLYQSHSPYWQILTLARVCARMRPPRNCSLPRPPPCCDSDFLPLDRLHSRSGYFESEEGSRPPMSPIHIKRCCLTHQVSPARCFFFPLGKPAHAVPRVLSYQCYRCCISKLKLCSPKTLTLSRDVARLHVLTFSIFSGNL